jgi:hypothetical protein
MHPWAFGGWRRAEGKGTHSGNTPEIQWKLVSEALGEKFCTAFTRTLKPTLMAIIRGTLSEGHPLSRRIHDCPTNQIPKNKTKQ